MAKAPEREYPNLAKFLWCELSGKPLILREKRTSSGDRAGGWHRNCLLGGSATTTASNGGASSGTGDDSCPSFFVLRAFEDLAHPGGQPVQRERLLEEVEVAREEAVAQHGTVSISGDEEDAQSGVPLPQARHDLA